VIAQEKPAAPAGAPYPTSARALPFTAHLTEIALGCQRTLAQNPHHPQALIGMSLVALASHQPELAVKMAAAATAAAPAFASSWIALGQALKACAQGDQAERAYMQALRLGESNAGADARKNTATAALARLGLGELYLAREQPQAGLREFELALRLQPTLAGASLGLGNALACMGRMQEALARYDHTLVLHPRLPEAEFAAGFALARLGRIDEAETRYRRALAARPDFAAAWINLGSLLREQGRELYAEAALRRAAQLRPDLVSVWINLATLARERNRPAEAERYLNRALALNPDQVETLIAWCQFRLAEHDLAGAWAWLRKALARDPNQNEAVNMEGILLHTEGSFAEAVVRFQRAEALGNLTAASNRGNSLLDLGHTDEALHAHEAAVARDPHHPGAAYNLALTRLRLGDWERGWPGYEARWRFREVHRMPRAFKQPRWTGELLHGRRILLHAEQGLGDTIQFCRYAALVVERGGVPILEVQPPVERLLRSLEVVRSGRAATAILAHQNLRAPYPEQHFDFECPLMSLPAVFGATPATVPSPGAFLFADPALVEEKRAAFPHIAFGLHSSLHSGWRFSLRPTLRIGLAWAGNPRYKADSRRSLRLEALLPLLRSTPATWISLQKGEAATQLADLPPDVSVLDGSSRDSDLAETAALLATLDLVITTDTCIAHLAGAMATPVWILLPHLADWRWMQSAETSPWYPSAACFASTRRAIGWES
jgi:tetratricopeptide (TPR) repeat protein